MSIGQFPTPPKAPLEVNEAAYEEGYDSDGNAGPYLDSKFDEEYEFYHETTIVECSGSEMVSRSTPEVRIRTVQDESIFFQSLMTKLSK